MMPSRSMPARFGFRRLCLRLGSVLAPVASTVLTCVACLPTVGATVALLAARPAQAQISIDWVTVGNPGNANNTTPNTGYGAVAYKYDIMKYEFTNSQYTAFLNAVDPAGSNPNSIYNSSMGTNARGGISLVPGNAAGSKYVVRSNMGDKPVNLVSWWDAARVANWLQKGGLTYGTTDASASAPQNTGAYTVGTATSGSAPAKNADATVWLPSWNEWGKAAYYDPTIAATNKYWAFGTQSNSLPTAVTADASGIGSAGSTGNFANFANTADWNGQDGNVTTVGTNGRSSYYGAFDMSGNAQEWNDTGTVTQRIAGGGGYPSATLSSSLYNFYSVNTNYEAGDVGFRLATVPEPSTLVLAGVGVACAGWAVWRRRRGAVV